MADKPLITEEELTENIFVLCPQLVEDALKAAEEGR